MKRTDNTQGTKRSFDELISRISENEVLTVQAMSHIRGGDGDGNGSEPIIIIPKPPQ